MSKKLFVVSQIPKIGMIFIYCDYKQIWQWRFVGNLLRNEITKRAPESNGRLESVEVVVVKLQQKGTLL